VFFPKLEVGDKTFVPYGPVPPLPVLRWT